MPGHLLAAAGAYLVVVHGTETTLGGGAVCGGLYQAGPVTATLRPACRAQMAWGVPCLKCAEIMMEEEEEDPWILRRGE